MTQLGLFDAPSAPYIRGNANSEAAALAITPHLGAMQQRVLEWLREHPGSTDNQIIAGVGGNQNGPRSRRIELCRKGLIEACGVKDGSQLWRAKQ